MNGISNLENGTLLHLIEGAESAFLRGRGRHSEDVEAAVGMFLELLRGFERLDVPEPCVTVFGSSRIDSHRLSATAQEFNPSALHQQP